MPLSPGHLFLGAEGTNSLVDHYTGGHGMSFCLEDQKPQPQAPPSPDCWGFSFGRLSWHCSNFQDGVARGSQDFSIERSAGNGGAYRDPDDLSDLAYFVCVLPANRLR
jgi:hypothetical protein